MLATEIGKFIIQETRKINHPMNDRLAQDTLNLCLMHEDQLANVEKKVQDIFMYKVLNGRIEACVKADNVDFKLKMWIMLQCTSPADAVLMTAVMKYVHETTGHLDLAYFMQFVFPMNVPNRDVMLMAWNKQKIDGVNGLDKAAAWT